MCQPWYDMILSENWASFCANRVCVCVCVGVNGNGKEVKGKKMILAVLFEAIHRDTCAKII